MALARIAGEKARSARCCHRRHPMDTFLATLHLAAFVALGFGLALPSVRRVAITLLVAAVLGSLGEVIRGPAERTLETVHTYAGFDGAALEASMVRFPTGTVTAAGWHWFVPFAAFAGLWIGILVWLQKRPLRSAFFLPLGYAWTASAAWIAMQMLAAPGEVVQPFGADRFLFAAGLAGALVAARTIPKFVFVLLAVSLSTIAGRLPIALFSKFASDRHLGTSLDVTNVRDIVNPMTQMQFDPPLQPGSSEQQFWLIWLEHVIVFPSLYLMSLVGVAFALFMFHHHGPASEAKRD